MAFEDDTSSGLDRKGEVRGGSSGRVRMSSLSSIMRCMAENCSEEMSPFSIQRSTVLLTLPSSESFEAS